jgi:hypothetical protein
LLHFWKFKITKVLYPNWLSPIDYHAVIPHWKGIHTVKMSSRLFAVTLLLATISVPATLMAMNDTPTGPAPKGPIVLPTPPGPPIDGNPTGPPKVVAGQ